MSAENKIFQYGDFEGVFDLSDYIVAEKWDNALSQLQEDNRKAAQLSKNHERIKAMIQTVANVFDNVFGEGTSNLVLGSSTSLDDTLTAFSALTDFAAEQTKEVTGKWQAIHDKYAPKNRAQRRKGK